MERTNLLSHRNRTFQPAGVSLVELLVAVAIGLFLLAGIVHIFASTKASYRVQSGAAALQESGRTALDFLGQSIRQAGHWYGVRGEEVTQDSGLVMTGQGSCSNDWLANTRMDVQGFDGAATTSELGNPPGNCIAANNYRAHTDVLVTRYASSGNLTEGGPFLRASVGGSGVLGLVPTGGGAPPTLGIPPGVGAANFPYHVDIWYVRNCSLPGGGSNTSECDAQDDDSHPIPTLVRASLSGTVLTQQPVAEGIEQLQIEYGRDMDGNGSVDRYDTASTLNAGGLGQVQANWAQVSEVRIALVARAQENPGLSGAGLNPNLVLVGDKGIGTSGYTPSTAEQNYLRKQYTQVFQLRNKSRL